MGSSWPRVGNLLAVLAFGAIGLLLCAGLLPPLEPGRTEVRSVQAHIQTRQLSQTVQPTNTEVVLSEVDPFGQPYRVMPLPDGRIRVLSAGPNETTPDADDIYNDMPESPGRPYARKRSRQLLIAVGAGGLFWILSSIAWLKLKPSDEDKLFMENG